MIKTEQVLDITNLPYEYAEELREWLDFPCNGSYHRIFLNEYREAGDAIAEEYAKYPLNAVKYIEQLTTADDIILLYWW